MTQVTLNCSGPPFLAPHKFPVEIILEIAKFLDDQSLVALRHTNHDLFCTIIPTVDQLSRVREARYLVEFVKLTNGANENRLGICTDCHELQPFTAFSISETKALGKLRDASCLRHAQFWMCPHVSYSYEEIIDLQFSGKGSLRIDELCGLPGCGRTQCRYVFNHRIDYSGRWPSQFRSEIPIFQIAHFGGPSTIRDAIRHYVTKARLRAALKMFRAPVCDHYLLSDERLREKFDPADLDLGDYVWQSETVPCEDGRLVRRSDDFCSYCQAVGAQTKFRFQADVHKNYIDRGVTIMLRAVVIRSLGSTHRRSDQPDEHWRCHGVTKRRLARFRDAWTQICSNVPYVVPASSDGVSADSRHS